MQQTLEKAGLAARYQSIEAVFGLSPYSATRPELRGFVDMPPAWTHPGPIPGYEQLRYATKHDVEIA